MVWGFLRILFVSLTWVSTAGALDDIEYLKSQGKLSNETFYRVLACNGHSGQKCRDQLIKWAPKARENLTVAIQGVGKKFPLKKAFEIEAALDEAVREINRAGAGIRLNRVEPGGVRPMIEIYLVNTRAGQVLRDVPSGLLRGSRIQIGQVHVGFRNNTIRTAHIAISRDIPLTQIKSVMLEELVQALGLLTDILNPYYTHRSIFAEDCNCTTTLRDQDAVALRLHYPPESF